MQLTAATYLIILPFVFLAAFIDSIAGGGGLIATPAYLAGGLPPHLALGSNKFSSTFGTLVATIRYFRHGLIDIPVAAVSAALALAGSFLGTRTVLLISPGFLNYVLLGLIPAIAVFTLVNKKVGMENTSHLRPRGARMALGGLAGFVIGFYDGFFGPGTGTFLIIFYAAVLKYDYATANGNTKVVNLASNVASLATFLAFGKVVFLIAVPAAVCGMAGNLLGSRLVITKGGKIVKPVIICAISILFAKIVWDTFIAKL